MDLNYLYRRREDSLFMAENAVSEAARRVHRELADAYQSRISATKSALSLAGTQ